MDVRVSIYVDNPKYERTMDNSTVGMYVRTRQCVVIQISDVKLERIKSACYEV